MPWVCVVWKGINVTFIISCIVLHAQGSETYENRTVSASLVATLCKVVPWRIPTFHMHAKLLISVPSLTLIPPVSCKGCLAVTGMTQEESTSVDLRLLCGVNVRLIRQVITVHKADFSQWLTSGQPQPGLLYIVKIPVNCISLPCPRPL